MENKQHGRGAAVTVAVVAVSVLAVALFIIVANCIQPFMIDNDNIYLKTVVSGEMLGRHEFHLCYIGSAVGALMARFYTLTGNSVPWFGILYCVCFGGVLAYITADLLGRCTRIVSKVFVFVICVIFYICVFYRFFAEAQFTILAGFLGAGALFSFAILDLRKPFKALVPGIVFAVLFLFFSHQWRENAFYMTVPFFGMVFLAKAIDVFRVRKTERLAVPNLAITCAILAGTLILSFAINKVTYLSPEWREFSRYNDAHTVMVDYYGFPDYDAHRDVYEANGIARSSYNALTGHYNLILDRNINAESFEALAEVAERNHEAASKGLIADLVATIPVIICRNLLDYVDRPINIPVFFLYAAVLVLSLMQKKYRAIRDLAFLIVARMFDWIYLVYNGRYPFRVTQIIYFAELLCLVAIILNYRLWESKKAFPVVIILLAIITLRFGFPVAKSVRNTIRGFEQLSTGFQEFEAYTETHPGNFYFFDMSNLHYREKLLDTRPRPQENYIYMGSWLVNSPWYEDKLRAEGIDDPAEALLTRDDLFLVYQVTDGYTRDFLDDYFAEHFPGAYITVSDIIETANGFKYEILKVNR